MGTTASKPKNKTGKAVVQQKVETATKTGILSLREHKLVQVPDKVASLVNIRTLDLSKNKLTHLSGIQTLSKLKTLKCDENELRSQSLSVVSNLKNLQVLSLNKNKLGRAQLDSSPSKSASSTHKKRSGSTKFPPLPLGLKQLNLNSNFFTSVPSQVFSLAKLDKLDLSQNDLVAIPSSIAKLKLLTNLNLDNNNIVSLPEEVGEMKMLKSLSLQNNQIQVHTTRFSEQNPQPLPASLFTSTAIIDLNLTGNAMTNSQLNEFEGFPDFLERRQAVKSKNIYGGAMTDLSVCGLE